MNSFRIQTKNSCEKKEPICFETCPDGRAKRVWHLPPVLGTGSFTTQYLEGGLELTISSIRLDSELNVRLMDEKDRCNLVFSLKGRSMNKNSFFKESFELACGTNCLYRSPDPELIRQAPRGEDLRAVVISVPRSRLAGRSHEFCTDMEGLPALTCGETCLIRHCNTPSMNLVLGQILDCRFTGNTKRFFLESKALELIALKLDLMDPLPASKLSQEQMQGVAQARDFLLKEIQNPPSISQLARAAGMSHPLLNHCFKRVFGCSVFGFLRKERLEMSRRMVAENEISMTDIAHATGYASSSHFSRAFLVCYGIQPSRYRKAAAGNPFFSFSKQNLKSKI